MKLEGGYLTPEMYDEMNAAIIEHALAEDPLSDEQRAAYKKWLDGYVAFRHAQERKQRIDQIVERYSSKLRRILERLIR